MAEEKKEVKKVSMDEAFVNRKLKVINAMQDGHKKQSLAERVLRNKGVK